MTFETRAVAAGYPKRVLVPDLSLEIASGTITAVIGPNGCGKSTLLRTLAGLLAPIRGTVLLKGHDLATLPTRQVARELAVLPQSPVAPSRITVRGLVEQGRYPHVGPIGMLRHQDDLAIAEALEATRLTALADREVDELSGGERQRAWIALALAQQTSTLLLDEPTTYLDIGYQLEVLELVADLNHRRGITVVMVLHDVNQAARFASRIVAMAEGRVVADGPPRELLTADLLRRVFAVEGRVVSDEEETPIFIPARSLRNRDSAP